MNWTSFCIPCQCWWCLFRNTEINGRVLGILRTITSFVHKNKGGAFIHFFPIIIRDNTEDQRVPSSDEVISWRYSWSCLLLHYITYVRTELRTLEIMLFLTSSKCAGIQDPIQWCVPNSCITGHWLLPSEITPAKYGKRSPSRLGGFKRKKRGRGKSEISSYLTLLQSHRV